jgi:hypothetical protein
MADKEISALTAASTLAGTELAHVVQGANSRKVTTTLVISEVTHSAAGKTTPVDADEMPVVDTAASNALKKLTWANVKATLKTYFDTLYVPAGTVPDEVVGGLITIASTAPSSPATGDIWIDTT